MSATEHWFPGPLRELSEEECLDLLRARSVGRVAFNDADGPVVLPVNYAVDDGTVLFRTAPQNTVARHILSGPAAFEVDETDDYTESGWSVLVRGRASFVEFDELPESGSRPVPWVEGSRSLYVRITPQAMTGRRVLAK
jgi:nitroimidazol reductase NimA-like FMN-containing flavoprotein (pyridoxamine 5'-phosphate oxidase superfamily)